MKRLMVAAAVLVGACSSVPAPPAGTDADTVAWWSITGDLSSDAMEGRDTGSAGYDRAADYVEARFRAAGLKAAGEGGGYRQTLLLKEVRVEKEGTRFAILSDLGEAMEDDELVFLKTIWELDFLHDITVRPTASLPRELHADLVFRGYCRPEDMTGVQNKVVICFGARRTGMTTGAQRLEAAGKAGASAARK